jgi:hypothetical protein
MKKIIRITESQLLNVVDSKKLLIELETSPTYIEHWENKFQKSAEVLLKLGHSADELIKKIQDLTVGNKEVDINSKKYNLDYRNLMDKPLLEH